MTYKHYFISKSKVVKWCCTSKISPCQTLCCSSIATDSSSSRWTVRLCPVSGKVGIWRQRIWS